ncbi:MAG: hypothetical protein JST39_01410, partial [Bacteroidetes bacterium]|nr:hypothetical protein [Bacteroidota bacterium]
RPLLALLVHWLLLAIVCTGVIIFFGNSVPSPSNANLRHWDAEWYFQIKTVGYYYEPTQMGPLAFFPLFPFVWKLSMLNEWGISLLNLLVFSVSFFYIARTLKMGFISSLLFLSTPSLLFCFIPYSEALFFMSSTIILIGLYKKNEPMILVGMCLAGFSRSVNIVLMPALVFTYVTAYGITARTIRFLCIAAISLTAAAFLVFWVQYLYTGQWLAFFDMQKQWHRTLQLPKLPVTTLSTKVLWLDIAALFISLMALLDGAIEFVRVFIRREKASLAPEVLFSIAYLAIMGFLAVFYSGVWPGQYGSSIMSINRFVFAGPYFIFYIRSRAARDRSLESNLTFVVALLVAFLCGGVYEKLPFLQSYTMTICYFGGIGLYLTLYFLSVKKQGFRLFFYTANLLIMAILFFDFLGYGWVG